MAVNTFHYSSGVAVLVLLLCCRIVLSRDGQAHDNDGVYVHILYPRPGSVWSPRMFPQLDVEVGNGIAADAVRASPFSTLVCYDGHGLLLHGMGELEPNTSAVCNPIMDAASSSSTLSRIVDVSPIDIQTGLAVVTAWIQSVHDVITPMSALGKPSRVYVWNDPIVAGRSLLGALNRRTGNLESTKEGFDLEGTTTELMTHLGVARSQEAAAWLRRAAEGNSFINSMAHAALMETLNDSREFSLAPIRALDKAQDQEVLGDAAREQLATNLGPALSKASASERIALVTISNMGYVDYTINAMATLRINCGMPCLLRTVCADSGCLSKLQASSEVAECPETVSLLTTDFDKDDLKGSSLSNFSNYRTSGFNAITRYKFVVIYDFLLTHEFVLFADGDIAFLRPDFIDYLANYMDLQPNLDLAAQCDLMVRSFCTYVLKSTEGAHSQSLSGAGASGKGPGLFHNGGRKGYGLSLQRISDGSKQ